MLIEEMSKEVKEYGKFVEEELEEENLYEEFESESEENNRINVLNKNINNMNKNVKKFILYFYFKLNENKEFIFPIESDFLNPDKQYGYELIENIINKINSKSIIINNNSKDYVISLKNSENNNSKDFYKNNYELRLCHKKSLKPKFDYPPLISDILLKDIVDEKISFICKNNLFIMMIEKYEEKEQNEEKKNGDESEEEVEEEEDSEELENEKEEHNNKKIKIKINKNYKFDKIDNSRSCIII